MHNEGVTAMYLSFIVTTKKSSNTRTRPELVCWFFVFSFFCFFNLFFLTEISLEKKKITLISQEHVLEHSSLPTSSTTGKYLSHREEEEEENPILQIFFGLVSASQSK